MPPPLGRLQAAALGNATDDEETVYSDGSGDPVPPSSGGSQPGWRDIWVARGRDEANLRYAYVSVLPAVAQPAIFIRDALESELGAIQVEMLPSSRGAMLACFPAVEERETAMQMSPFLFQGHRVELERSEETSNRFHCAPRWLGYLSVRDFPIEHWFAEHIEASLRCIGTVVEIDPTCLNGFDFSSVRIVVELEDDNEDDVPTTVCIRCPGGAGCNVRCHVVRIWPRAAQLDQSGAYMPFFTPPPPPAPAPPNSQATPPPASQPAQHLAAPPLAPPHPPPCQRAFTSLDLIDAIQAYPLPRLPQLPLIISLPCTTPRQARNTPLLLTWHEDTTSDMAPPPSPPAPESPPPIAAPVGAAPAPRRRLRRTVLQSATKCRSIRLANKEKGVFVDATAQAVQLKALRNSLNGCSGELQKLVTKSGLLKTNQKAVTNRNLRKLVTAAGLGVDSECKLELVIGNSK